MKKFIFLSLVLAFIVSVNANAQLIDKFAQKKQVELFGTIGFTSTTKVTNGETGDASTNLTFAPSVGIFVTKGFELGAKISFDYTKAGGTNGDKMTTYSLLFTPAWNFHTKSQFYPYLEGQIGYNGASYDSYSTITNTTTTTTLKGIVWGVEGGVKANLLGNALLKFGINYTNSTLNPETYDKRNGYNYISAMLGIGMFF